MCPRMFDYVDWPITTAGRKATVNCPEGYKSECHMLCVLGMEELQNRGEQVKIYLYKKGSRKCFSCAESRGPKGLEF